MKIRDLFKTGAKVFSFEFFPPKTEEGVAALSQTIEDLRTLRPSFVSVTYGAGGSTRDRTIDLVDRIKNRLGIEAMAHLTCVGAGREEIVQVLDRLKTAGIENILALRGDPPNGRGPFIPPAGGFAHASDLIAFIRPRYDFCLGGAAYPEGHLESKSLEEDLAYTKRKVEAGAEFLITQMFFDNRFYFDFVARARAAGIAVPILPGIMPVTNLDQIKRFTELCGAKIPASLLERLEKVREDPEAVRQIGVEHAAAQCRDLLAGGAPGIHFYTLNRSTATRRILQRLRQ
ncbi:MAG: methylenetetrahydrofolate reductase [NAD(P)H] [Nitrospirae bacterium]|nr:methylenetetrahydrofolate reductase [NAD(P)H] [Nitrospirota bacterium]